MGYRLSISPESGERAWGLTVTVSLTRAESNDLFLSGDTMVSWPLEGLMREAAAGLERSGIFVSEVAARPEGLLLRYAERAQAERAGGLLRLQLAKAGLEETPLSRPLGSICRCLGLEPPSSSPTRV
jgi:hypothetical protein